MWGDQVDRRTTGRGEKRSRRYAAGAGGQAKRDEVHDLQLGAGEKRSVPRALGEGLPAL